MFAVHGARRSTRALVLLGVAALLLIAGLLAMHSFSAEPAGHGLPPTGYAAAAHPHEASAAHPHEASAAHPQEASAEHGSAASAPADTGMACGPACASDPDRGHAGMLMVCVLALLAALLLVLPPTLRTRHGAVPRDAARLLVAASRGILPRPPSLITLSISRT